MTPNKHAFPPLPLVTRINPVSKRYWQFQRFKKVSAAFLNPVYAFFRAKRTVFSSIGMLIALIVRTLWKTIVTVLRVIDHIADAILTFIYETIITILKGLAKPLLALGALLLALTVFTPENRKRLALTAPELAKVTPAEAALPSSQSAVTVPAPPPVAKKSKLALFHQNAQQLTSQAAQVESLADALNIPPPIVSANVERALALADTNARAMQPYVGTFPLPQHTSGRLLASLTPADVALLTRLLEHATTIDKTSFTMTSALASGDLAVDIHVRQTAQHSMTHACYHYALAFRRRTFTHTLTINACLDGRRWSFLTTAEKRPFK